MKFFEYHPYLKRILGVLVPVVMIAVAVLTLRHYARDVTWEALVAALKSIDAWRIEVAMALTAISFVGMAMYDVIAADIVAPGRVPVLSAAFAGAAGNAISNTLGFHVFTGGALRYRVYTRHGLGMGDVGRMTGLSLVGLGMGYLAAITTALWFAPLPKILAVAMTLVVALMLYYKRKPRRINIGSWSLTFPNTRQAIILLLVGGLEMAIACGTLFILLPHGTMPNFAMFLLIYIGAVWMGVISHVPGGVGVLEATLITILPAVDRTGILASLLVYRLVYNIMPFITACIAVTINECRRGPSV